MTQVYPAIPEPTTDVNALWESTMAIKEAIEIMLGRRGSGSITGTSVVGTAGGTGATGSPGPAGPTGPPGGAGPAGPAGLAATVSVGTTTTLAAGAAATATNVGTTSAAIINFGIPQGATGSGSGDMLRSLNLSDVANAATSRTNLGLGSAATLAASAVAQTANNLSDLASAVTAFNNISPMTTRGDMIFRNASTNARLASSTAGYFLQTNGAATDPAWVGFLNPGTSATTRTWNDKATDWVSVRDFGAVGDGSTNDATAIQNAINYVSTVANGGVVYFPNGTYLVNTALSITASYITLVGAGHSSSTIRYSGGASVEGVVFDLGGSTGNGGGVRGIGFEAYGTAKTSGAAIRCKKWNDFRLDNIAIHSPFIGLQLTDTFFTAASNINIATPVNSATSVGVLCDSVTYIAASHIFTNVFVQGISAGARGGHGFEIQFSGGTWFYGCQSLFMDIGLYLNPPSSRTVEHIWSYGCAWDQCGYGIYVNTPSASTVRRFMSVGDWGSTNTNAGFYQAGAGTTDDIQIIGFQAYQNGTQGINFNTASNVFIKDCIISGNSATTSGAADGIAINGSNISVQNCRSGATGPFGATQRYGILINGTNTNNQITNNNLSGNGTSGIGNFLTSTTSRIEGNIGYNPIGASGITVGGSPYPYTSGSATESVHIRGGTVSNVTVDSVSLATTSPCSVTLPPNKTLIVTYSAAPTMNKVVQ